MKGEPLSTFAKRMGFNSHKIVQDWNKGQQPSIKSLLQIKEKLGISQEHFDVMCHEAHGVVLRKIDITLEQMELDEITSALQLPRNPVIEKLCELQRVDESEAVFIRRIGIDAETWLDWKMKEPKDITITILTGLLERISENIEQEDIKTLTSMMQWSFLEKVNNKTISEKTTPKSDKRKIQKTSFPRRRIA
jgi:hypothetical protein